MSCLLQAIYFDEPLDRPDGDVSCTLSVFHVFCYIPHNEVTRGSGGGGGGGVCWNQCVCVSACLCAHASSFGLAIGQWGRRLLNLDEEMCSFVLIFVFF